MVGPLTQFKHKILLKVDLWHKLRAVTHVALFTVSPPVVTASYITALFTKLRSTSQCGYVTFGNIT